MPQQRQAETPWSGPLAGRLARSADVAQVAGAIVALWLEIDQALHPVIGHRGVAALYNRSLYLTAVRYPWMAVHQPVAAAAIDTQALQSVLLLQKPAEAGGGGTAHLQNFHELLASLVGATLTERLLDSIWTRAAGPTHSQDTAP
jgi:hypothetical protein